MESKQKEKQNTVKFVGNIEGRRTVVDKETPVPKIEEITWTNKGGEKIEKAKYGKKMFLHIDTEDASDCWLLVAVHCEEWEKPYQTGFIKVGENSKPPYRERTIYQFTADVSWLKESENKSNKITTEVYLLCSLYNYRYFIENSEKKHSDELAEHFRKEGKDSFFFSPFTIQSYGSKKSEEIELSKIVIVIDPGHGDHHNGNSQVDPGACNGSDKEKDYVLTIANSLSSLLIKENVVIKMTRTKDVAGVGERLKWRVDKATGTEMFVSIHLNSHDDSTPKGYEVLYKSGCVDSENLAESILKENTLFKKRGIIESTAYVLKHYNLGPAVLVEAGFISNKEDLDIIKEKP